MVINVELGALGAQFVAHVTHLQRLCTRHSSPGLKSNPWAFAAWHPRAVILFPVIFLHCPVQ